jgi:hypothetical protein
MNTNHYRWQKLAEPREDDLEVGGTCWRFIFNRELRFCLAVRRCYRLLHRLLLDWYFFHL